MKSEELQKQEKFLDAREGSNAVTVIVEDIAQSVPELEKKATPTNQSAPNNEGLFPTGPLHTGNSWLTQQVLWIN